ncbi:MAG TPA: enoyl-CoA hydratase/isomerase family protein [Arenimonas sp.]|nr:enoyl-CoA hydratase/isomerase family protein [Arenimonas sp.]
MIETISHDSLVEIKLKRAPVNALNFELLDLLVNTIDRVVSEGAQGIVLSGGQKVFSGGLDVPYLLACSTPELKACWSRFFDAARAIAKSPVPVVASIAGHNPAGGCVLALCCDYRVMAKGPYRIGLNETQVGLAVPEAIQYLMRRIVGAHRTERLVVAGAMIESQQAFELGIIDELATQETVTEVALNWLRVHTALPQGPMRTTRAIARADIIKALEGFSTAEMENFIEGWYSNETQGVLKSLFAKK